MWKVLGALLLFVLALLFPLSATVAEEGARVPQLWDAPNVCDATTDQVAVRLGAGYRVQTAEYVHNVVIDHLDKRLTGFGHAGIGLDSVNRYVRVALVNDYYEWTYKTVVGSV